jgi:hypothetical protein
MEKEQENFTPLLISSPRNLFLTERTEKTRTASYCLTALVYEADRCSFRQLQHNRVNTHKDQPQSLNFESAILITIPFSTLSPLAGE